MQRRDNPTQLPLIVKSMKAIEQQYSRGWLLVCVMCTVLLMVLAFLEIQRVEHGNLFLTALPWDDAPSTVETLDAVATARMYLVPALLFLGMIGTVVYFLAPRAIRQRAKLPAVWRPLAILFLLAVTADLATTLWFFHSRGIDHELHPGVRLFGYAYGRTVGPLAGKAVQAAGVIGLSMCLNRGGLILLSLVTFIYLIGAAYNVSQMLAGP